MWYCPKDSCLLKVAPGDSAASHKCIFEPYNGRQCADEAFFTKCQCDGLTKLGTYEAWTDEKETTNGSIDCNTDVFGDPASGKPKFCWCTFREQDNRKSREKSVALYDAACQEPAAKASLESQGYYMSAPVSCLALEGVMTIPAVVMSTGLLNEGVPRMFVPSLLAGMLSGVSLPSVRVLRSQWGLLSNTTFAFQLPEGKNLASMLGAMKDLQTKGDEIKQAMKTRISAFNDAQMNLVANVVNIQVKTFSGEAPPAPESPCDPAPTPEATPNNEADAANEVTWIAGPVAVLAVLLAAS